MAQKTILRKGEDNWITEQQLDKDTCFMLKEMSGSATKTLNFVSFVYFEALKKNLRRNYTLMCCRDCDM